MAAQSERKDPGLRPLRHPLPPSLRLTAVNIGGCQLPRGAEVNTDELALRAEGQAQPGPRHLPGTGC